MALANVLDALTCPACDRVLVAVGRAVRCDAGHGFDVARSGHISLLRGAAPPSADTAAMVAARERVLARGAFDAVSGLVAGTATRVTRGVSAAVVVDVGGGTGHHLARVLDTVPSARGLTLDSSLPAVRRAARAHPRAAAVRADAWQRLPLRDDSIDLAIVVFAPRPAAELARVVRPGGAVVVVVPTPRHLTELVDALGLLTVPADKERDVVEAFVAGFEHERTEHAEHRVDLDADLLRDLVVMGPSAWHGGADAATAALTAGTAPAAATVSVAAITLRRRG